MNRGGKNLISYNSTADEIHDSGTDTAVLPIGSTEQHGHHLPVFTDSIIAASVSEKIAEKLGAYLLPVLPISTCREHMGKRGSVWINPDTFYYMVRDIVMSLKEQGFKKVVIVIGHGGIFIANPIIRELNATNQDIKVIKVDFLQFIGDALTSGILECKDNLHACEYETSLMLYINEQLVRKEKIVDFVPDVPRDYLNYGSIFKFCKDGVWGKPSLATREKGEKLFDLLVDHSIDYINSIKKILD